MAFGFDASIILGANKTDPTSGVRTLADLAMQRQQVQQSQATLADLLQRQQRAATLESIYRQNAGSPDALPHALMRGGYGQEAYGAQDQASQLRTQAAQQAKLVREIQDAQRKQLGELFYGVKDQSGWDGALQQVPEMYRGMIPPTFDAKVAQRLSDLAIPAEKRADLARQRARDEESARHNKAMEGRPPGMMPIILGEGGAQYFSNPLTSRATPITGPDGAPIVKPQAKAGRALTKGDRDALEHSFGEASSLGALMDRFKDSYAGKGAAGKTLVDLNKKLGSWASDDAQEEANFWADFQGSFDLSRRNKLFGASLTPGEQAAWEGAKTITPNSKPAVVRKALKDLQDAAISSARRRGRSLAKDGFSADAIEEFTGPLGLDDGPQKATGSGPLRVASDAEYDKLPSGAQFIGPDGKLRKKP